MTHRLLAPAFSLLAFAAACSQLPSKPPDRGAPGARYVDEAALTGGAQHGDAQILTAVALSHVAAADAETRLRAELPAGVRVSLAGGSEQLLLQGRGPAVAEAVQRLKRIDAR